MLSGGGAHAYWLLDKPLTDLTGQARRLLRKLALKLGADISAAEPARMLRVPGTVNRKYQPVRQVVLQVEQADHIHTVNELERELARVVDPDAARDGKPFTLEDGDIPEGQRRPTLFRFGRKLVYGGATYAEVLAAFHVLNQSRCRPPLPNDVVEQKARECVEQPDRPGYQRANADGIAHDDCNHGTHHVERFLGYRTIEQVRNRLADLDKGLSANINLAYEDEFVAAAAALEHFNSAEAERLAIKLKGKGISKTNWQRLVHERARQERARIAEAERATKTGTRQKARASTSTKFAEVKLAAEPVTDGALLLSEIRDFIRRFVRISEMQAVAVVLWIAGVYAFSITDIFPRMAILSVKKRCGKSRLETMVAMLVPRMLRSSNVSTAVLFRLISGDDGPPPTVLLDEADSSIFARRGATSERTEALRGLINAGYEKATAFVDRCETIGNQQITKRFHVWAPMALAAIGRVPDTVEDRSIIITMTRRLKSEPIEKLTRRNQKAVAAEAEKLASRLARWISDNLNRLAKAEPKFPDGLDDRAEDLWDLALSVADLAGSTWAVAARTAALALSSHRNDDDGEGFDLKLLTDIRTVIDRSEHATEKTIGSTMLCDSLRGLEDTPWASFGRNPRPLSTRMLAMLLRPFGVYPKKESSGNGYEISVLLDVISRFLPDTATPSEIRPPSSKVPEPHGGEGNSIETDLPEEFSNGASQNGDSPTAREGSGTMEDEQGNFDMGAGPEKNPYDDAMPDGEKF